VVSLKARAGLGAEVAFPCDSCKKYHLDRNLPRTQNVIVCKAFPRNCRLLHTPLLGSSPPSSLFEGSGLNDNYQPEMVADSDGIVALGARRFRHRPEAEAHAPATPAATPLQCTRRWVCLGLRARGGRDMSGCNGRAVSIRKTGAIVSFGRHDKGLSQVYVHP